MCGFTGIISKKEYNDDSIRSMLDSIRHRGPDNLSFYENENLHLGFARLQIIDLDPRSNQPMIDEETGAVIVFNGEVYNYKELRPVSYTHLRAHETEADLVCRLLLEKKKN